MSSIDPLSHEILIRPYKEFDHQAVIELFDANSPNYFHPSERKAIIDYLNNEREDYYVVTSENTIIGAGGINYDYEHHTAKLSWDMVQPTSQGSGIGKMLTQFRLNRIQELPGIKTIEVRTSQLAHSFYEKVGFVIVDSQKDYWAPGFDLFSMEFRNFRRD